MRTSKTVPAILINSIADENLRNRAAVAGIELLISHLVGSRIGLPSQSFLGTKRVFVKGVSSSCA